MRWPIRYQILLPFAAVVLLAITGLTGLAAVLAAQATERQTLLQLQNTIDTLASTKVPYTPAILQKIRGFSGAHLIACDRQGKIAASTLPEGETLPGDAIDAPERVDLSAISSQPVVELSGGRYYVARLEPRRDDAIRSLYVLYPVESWNRAQREAALLPVMVGGPALLLTSAVALWISQRFSKRLRNLQEQVAAIAAGDFHEIAPGQRVDEIQDLTLSVNQMAARLREMQRTIRQSERSQLLAQLAGGLAHQLRNAVAGTRLALQLHQRRCPAATNDQSLSVALRQLALTETQVRGLLSLGRTEHRAPEFCDVGDLVTEIESLLEPTCEHASVSLIVDRGPAGASVFVEVEGLRGAVLNLALNAIEAAGRGGTVRIETRIESGKVSLDVRDTGAGPPTELGDSLFEPFVTSKPEGVGLGLALARQVAIDHGGTLSWFRKDAETIFRLTLPQLSAGQLSAESSRDPSTADLRQPEHSQSVP